MEKSILEPTSYYALRSTICHNFQAFWSPRTFYNISLWTYFDFSIVMNTEYKYYRYKIYSVTRRKMSKCAGLYCNVLKYSKWSSLSKLHIQFVITWRQANFNFKSGMLTLIYASMNQFVFRVSTFGLSNMNLARQPSNFSKKISLIVWDKNLCKFSEVLTFSAIYALHVHKTKFQQKFQNTNIDHSQKCGYFFKCVHACWMWSRLLIMSIRW